MSSPRAWTWPRHKPSMKLKRAPTMIMAWSSSSIHERKCCNRTPMTVNVLNWRLRAFNRRLVPPALMKHCSKPMAKLIHCERPMMQQQVQPMPSLAKSEPMWLRKAYRRKCIYSLMVAFPMCPTFPWVNSICITMQWAISKP